MKIQAHNSAVGCNDACRFKNLYEGSQLSLADLAKSQITAISRVDAIRGGVIAQLKRSFPKQHEQAERAAGVEFKAFADTALISYLESFLATRVISTPITAGESQDVKTLKTLLHDLGLSIPASVVTTAALISHLTLLLPTPVQTHLPVVYTAPLLAKVTPAREAYLDSYEQDNDSTYQDTSYSYSAIESNYSEYNTVNDDLSDVFVDRPFSYDGGTAVLGSDFSNVVDVTISKPRSPLEQAHEVLTHGLTSNYLKAPVPALRPNIVLKDELKSKRVIKSVAKKATPMAQQAINFSA